MMVGAAGRRGMRARQCLAPTRSGQKPHVSQRRGDPLGRPRSFMPTRSFMAGTNKSRGSALMMVGAAGRRGMRARQCLAPTRSGQKPHVSQRRGDPLGRPRSFMPTRSFMAGTNKSRGSALMMVGAAGRRGMRARQCLAPTRSGQKPHVSQRRGDPLGRPRSFMPTRSFMAGTNKSRGSASEMVGAAGRRRIRARRASPPRSGQKPHVSQRRGDPLGRPRSFMPTRVFMAGTNKSRGVPRPHGPAKSPMCPNVGATHWVAPGHSCQRACSWLGQTNREACLDDGGCRGASPDEGEAVPRPYAVRPKAPCVPT